jgi:hypothetical protein
MSDTKPSSELGYEVADTRPGVLVLWAVAILAVAVLAAIASWLLFERLAAKAARIDTAPSPLLSPQLPPEPRLIVNEPADLKMVRQEEQQVLEGYAWVDKARGIVRIPVARALELVAKEGLPSREAGRETP